jgi:hypothetical protein
LTKIEVSDSKWRLRARLAGIIESTRAFEKNR